MIIIEMFVLGVFATFFMDILAKILAKRKIIHSFLKPEAMGRWFLYMFKGKFFHNNINETPKLNNEKLWALIAHYLIGIALAGIYLLLEFIFPEIKNMIWLPLAFGISTCILPWFWLFPSIGIGFIASKSPDQLKIIKTSLINHTNFGLGFLILEITYLC